MASPTSSDEGEIIENGRGDLKATTLPDFEGNGVDRRDRNRARTPRSPDSHDSRSHRSPRRDLSPRGYKRSRDDPDSRHRGGRGFDGRQFRVHYEDSSRGDSRRARPYDDQDRPPSRGVSGRYDDLDRSTSYGANRHRDHRSQRPNDTDRDRDRYPQKRHRTRSRSPYAADSRNGGRRDRERRDFDRFDRRPNEEHPRPTQYSARHESNTRDGHSSKRTAVTNMGLNDVARSKGDVAAKAKPAAPSQKPQESVLSDLNAIPPVLTSSLRSSAEHASQQPEFEPQQDWEEDRPIDVDAEIERRRRRREEILRKSRASTPVPHLSLQGDNAAVSTPGGSTQVGTPARSEVDTPRSGMSFIQTTQQARAHQDLGGTPGMSPVANQTAPSPEPIDLANDQDLINVHGHEENGADADDDGPSAANYDPTADMQEDERRDERRQTGVGLHGQERRGSIIASDADKPTEEQPPVSESKDEDDGDDFDMFADDFDESKYAAPKATTQANGDLDKQGLPAQIAQGNAGGILEGDDKDGYYKIRPGEILDGRYQIQTTLGKGMFSGVARAVDVTTKNLVAIKMMRNNDALRKGGFTEIAILEKLNEADPENKRHIVKFERWFEYKGHLCMAFENLSLNLREVLKKFGNNVGINLKGVRVYAYQIFVALAHMRKCSIVHADLKPDNILVNEARNVLKICDLGTAIDRSDAATAHNEITPYLVSRFYRAPEIILGMSYDYAVDMWSIGCTLYELYTGKILFTGDSNNQMLRAIMEIRGKISAKMYRRGQLWHLHFDDLGNFVSQERDKVLGKPVMKILPLVKPTRDLRTRLLAASSGMSEMELKELNLFHDLLQACLTLNPEKRITPMDALKHPFFTSRMH
ncbi:uncharacterized protein E0L32_006860 [Thyridium curvatum]|uniref:non-specific serine/threonine protein kinase n=1 Tax=Thyridium curvatum TaxID=1093900 RepID=A0A507B6I3_9PEZI|nr:uncharacterized protein E0L32_006860 [Thyridium curvatum]TPX12448.1 hypothetical protein E0L32_006860 [Thyridium curvatum]